MYAFLASSEKRFHVEVFEVSRTTGRFRQTVMINEFRTYQIKVGSLGAYLSAFEGVALPLIRKHMTLLGFWTSDIGLLNCVYHLWAHEDHAGRERGFAALRAEPAYQMAFLPVVTPLIVQMNSVVLQPTAFMRDLPVGAMSAQLRSDKPFAR